MLRSARRFPAVLAIALLTGSPVIRAQATSAGPRLRIEPGAATSRGSLVRRPSYLVRGTESGLNRAKTRGLGPVRSASSGARDLVPFSPTVDGGFDAMLNSNPIASPSDSTGSISPNWVAAAVNVHFAIFNRTGGMVSGTNFRLNKMFAGLPKATDTDPKVVYDPYESSFILVYLLYTSTNSWIVAAYIPDATANDPHTWCPLLIPGDQIRGNGVQVADYPGLGFTSDRVTITTNQFTTSLRYSYVQVLSMRSSQFFDPSCTIVPHIAAFGGKQTTNPDGTKSFTIQPAVSFSATDATATTQYMASFERGKLHKASHLILWSLRSVNGTMHLGEVALKAGPTAVPPWGLQKGGSASNSDTYWDTADLRLTTAFYDADRNLFYTANAVKHSFTLGYPVSAVRWYEASPAGSLSNSTLTRNGFVGEDQSYAAWPSVATDQNGVLFINFAQASLAKAEYLSVYLDTVPLATTTADPEQLIKAGGARYGFAPGPERWGDYSAIARDPAPASAGLRMTAFGAYALDSGFAATNLWQQWCGTVHQA